MQKVCLKSKIKRRKLMKGIKIYFLLLVSLLVFGILVPQSANAIPVKWDSSIGGNDHYYDVVLVQTGINWLNANNDAIANGGYLATITSADENWFIYLNLVSNSTYWYAPADPFSQQNVGPWIGAYQPYGSTEPDGGWLWINNDGSLNATFQNWLPGEPNNFGQSNENAALFYDNNLNNPPVTTPFWNDWSIYNHSASYVIEYNSAPVPEPATILLLGAGLLGLAGIGRKKLKK